MPDDKQGSNNPLDQDLLDSVLGSPMEGPLGTPDFGTQEPPGYIEFGRGDLARDEQTGPMASPERRAPDRNEWQGVLRAIVADHTPSVGLRFRAWAIKHKDSLNMMTTAQAFAYYIEAATYRDAMADQLREVDDQQYDWLELHMDGLRPMIEAEVQAGREEIADGVRQAYDDRLQALHDQGLISGDVLQMMKAGVSNG